ncbi:MAG: hypothetical protein ACLQVY_13415 [Limisphaerales bacterium]
MNARVDYGQLAAKLDYEALNKKLEQLSQREAPKKRKTVVDALEPLRERLLALHRKGWSSGQLVEELKAAGVPVSPARMRECLGRWTGGGNGSAKSHANRRKAGASARESGNGPLAAAASPASRTRGVGGDGQGGLKFGATASASAPKP